MSTGRRAKRAKPNNLVKVFLLSVAAVVVLGLAAGFALQLGGKVFPNVSAAGVQLGGKTEKQAAEILEAEVGAAYSQPMRILIGDEVVTLDPQKTDVSLDAKEAAKLARKFGRDRGPINALVTYFECLTAPRAVDIRQSLHFNDAYVREEVNTIVREASQPVEQSRAEFKSDPDRMEVTIGKEGREIPFETLYEAIVDAYNRADFSDIPVRYEATLPEPLALTDFYRTYCVAMENAHYDAEEKRIVPEVEGYGFDLAEVQQRVNEAKEGDTFTVPFEKMIPEITTADVTKQYFSDEFAAVDAPHTYNPPRTENLRLACLAINGTILNPGDTFSFNKVVGERTKAKGYKDAIVFGEGGTSEEGTGGGVCQVASAIYYAALKANMKIVERTEHMYVVDYVPMGMDATVYWGSLDFKFQNASPSPLAIMAWVEGGYVHIRLNGTKPNDWKKVKMTYEVLKSDPFEIVEEWDEEKEAGFEEVRVTGYTGYLVRTYKHYLDQNDKEISVEYEATSNYKRRDKIITHGGPQPPDPNAPVDPTTPTDPTPTVPTVPTDPMPATDPTDPLIVVPETPTETAPQTTPEIPATETPAQTETTPAATETPAA